MEQVFITRTCNADTRTATEPVSKQDLLLQTREHIKHVRKAFLFFQHMIDNAAANHDHTKISAIDKFHEEFTKTQETGVDFTDGEWYPMHVSTERHHLTDHVPEDVNLVDVLERICDCVVAGMSRKGSVYPNELSPEILSRAYANTFKLLADRVVVSGNCPKAKKEGNE